jgi:hypothetical protein
MPLPELPSLQLAAFSSPGFINPPQPKKAWTRRIMKKNTGGHVSPAHVDFAVVDGGFVQPQSSHQVLHQPAIPGRLRKQPVTNIKRSFVGSVAARMPRDDGDVMPSSRDKQWEFRMPGDVSGVQETSTTDLSKQSLGVASQDRIAKPIVQRLTKPAAARFLRGSPEPFSSFPLERKVTHAGITLRAIGATGPAPVGVKTMTTGLHAKGPSSLRPHRFVLPAISPTAALNEVEDFPLHVEGSAFASAGVNLGVEDDTVQAAQALSALELNVAKERRLKEELAKNHKSVLRSFRGVVAAFFSGVRGTAGPPKKSLALAKCSVVVHTLVSTIQTYLRWRQSHQYLALLRQGLSLFASRVALSSQLPAALDPSLLDALPTPSPVTYTESMAGTPFSTDSGSMHDVLDSQAIAHLKQLYFDYYDCECFILPGMREGDCGDDHGSDVQTLDMECRSVHSVIEERNVLVASAGDEGVDEQLEVQEEEGCCVADSPPAAHPTTWRLPNGSMVFDETVERERIFGADDSSEDSGSNQDLW